MKTWPLSTCFLFSALLLAVGCGKNVPVSGTVVFNDDHSPLTSGVIIFDNGIQTGRAKIEQDGTFIVGFEKNENGIPEGTWRVAIVGAEELLPCPQNEDDDPTNDIYPKPSKPLIDARYNNAETSDLTVTVDKSTRAVELTVDRFTKKSKRK
ncbi:MAG: hypothetical protein Q4G68_11205 [Planctomycetia bacterium]|nr:hypothetical protein [Planctomycetia bacterium]